MSAGCFSAYVLPPHSIEPKYPGAVESLVNLSACWDEDKLFACRGDIVALASACTARHEHCCRFLNAASILSGDTYRIALDSLDAAKLSAYCDRFAARTFRPRKGKSGREKIRLISAVTNKGIYANIESMKILCPKLYLINDDYGAVSRMMLHKLRAAALGAGYDVITSYCPLGPFDRIEHLIFPELGIGFLTSNRAHDFNLAVDPYRIVNSKRFLRAEGLKKAKRRLAFNRRAEQQMVAQAEHLLADAKQLHDELETYYIAATDFEKVQALTQEVLDKIERIAAGE